MLNTLQIILHLPLINVLFPSNVASFFTYLIDVAEFELIPTESLTSKLNNDIQSDFNA